jgi:hypothetical protein
MLLDVREILTPADHQTHRQYPFSVPAQCARLDLHVRYSPKFISAEESRQLVDRAVARQRTELRERVGQARSDRWASDFEGADLRIPNLLTVSLDDAAGAYRGAGHRHTADQRLVLGQASASPGLYAGPLPPGDWTLTLTAHTLVSAQCEVEIQIGEEIASSRP